MFRGMSKPLQNQPKSTHHIDHSVKEAMGGMNVQVALVNSTWLAFSPNACDIRLKMTEVCIKEIKGNILVFDTFWQKGQLSKAAPFRRVHQQNPHASHRAAAVNQSAFLAPKA